MGDDTLIQALRSIVGEQHVLHSPADLAAYAVDATPLYRSLPTVVVFPGCTAEVKAILELASAKSVPVIPRGAASNLSGGTIALQGGIMLNMNRMNQILEIDTANLTATVQPGVTTAQLAREVDARGLFYPPDPGSQVISTLGGNVAENAGGLRGLKYGVTRDYVMGLEAVLPNGEILRTGGKNAKDVAGYDLTRLLVGSEGTLAVLTEITVKLIPKPETKRAALAIFDALDAAANAVARIIENRIIPCTLEIMDQGTIKAVEEFAHVGLPMDAAAVLLIEQDGARAVVDADIELAGKICREEGARDVKVAATVDEGTKLAEARRFALPALARLRPTCVLEDATVPRSNLATMIRFIDETAKKYKLTICTFGHAGDGNLHPTCPCDERDHEEIERVEHAFEEIFDKALALGGTITGEHGVGLAKQNYLEWKIGAAGVAVSRGLKAAFDPANILNPGKVLPKATRKRLVVKQG
ncbi:MAG TPA: FAD-linked oxidase C-terminal domain-containing protein [Symbiobacteriaceae bacterium]|nr:FAD-linked oxidase C-terminal domain-containing protein [Symbiobacteriaceae bacterium]